MPAAAPSEAPEKNDARGDAKEQGLTPAEKKIAEYAKENHDKVVNAATPAEGKDKTADAPKPDINAKAADGASVIAESKPSGWLEYKSLPEGPSSSALATTAKVAAVVANPVVGGLVVGHLWLWDKMKHTWPLRYVEKARASAWNVATSGLKNVWDTVTYLPRLGGIAALNVAKSVPRGVSSVSGWAWEKFTDIFEETPGESKHVFEKLWDKTTEWAGKIIEAPFKIGGWYLKNAFAHPWRTLTGTAFAAGIIAYGPLTFSEQMVELIGKAMEAGIKYLGR